MEVTDAEEIVRVIVPYCFTEDFIQNNPDVVEQLIQRALKAPILKFAFDRQSEAGMKWDACRRIKKINTPTLIIHGKKDILVPVQNADILAKRIPGAKKVILENSGHGMVEDLEKFIQTIIEFLEG